MKWRQPLDCLATLTLRCVRLSGLRNQVCGRPIQWLIPLGQGRVYGRRAATPPSRRQIRAVKIWKENPKSNKIVRITRSHVVARLLSQSQQKKVTKHLGALWEGGDNMLVTAKKGSPNF